MNTYRDEDVDALVEAAEKLCRANREDCDENYESIEARKLVEPAIRNLKTRREAARVDAGMCDISKHAPVRKALESLVAVLCDPEGKCCISGSDEDRKIVDSGLSTIFEAINVPEICKTGCEHYDVYGACDLEQANSKIASLTAELAAAKADNERLVKDAKEKSAIHIATLHDQAQEKKDNERLQHQANADGGAE